MHNSHKLADALGIVGQEYRKAKDASDKDRANKANAAYGAILQLFSEEDYEHLANCSGMTAKC